MMSKSWDFKSFGSSVPVKIFEGKNFLTSLFQLWVRVEGQTTIDFGLSFDNFSWEWMI